MEECFINGGNHSFERRHCDRHSVVGQETKPRVVMEVLRMASEAQRVRQQNARHTEQVHGCREALLAAPVLCHAQCFAVPHVFDVIVHHSVECPEKIHLDLRQNFEQTGTSTTQP